VDKKTEASTTSESTVACATTSGATLVLAKEGSAAAYLKRRSLAGFVLIASLLTWVTLFIVYGLAAEALAWCVALMLTAGLVIALIFGKQSLPATSIFRLGEVKPLSFTECSALSFIGFSMAILLWLSMHNFHLSVPKEVRRQVVDIEFVSSRDYADHHDILPSTEPKPTQKKREGTADKTLQGTKLKITDPVKQHVASNANAPSQTTDKAQPVKAQERQETKAQKVAAKTEKELQPKPAKEARLAQRPSQAAAKQADKISVRAAKAKPISTFKEQAPEPFIAQHPDPSMAPADSIALPSRWSTKTYAPVAVQPVSQSRSTPNRSRNSSGAMFEEVAAPELIELAETQGQNNATDAYQTGGRSSGGKGAQSTLVVYLNELHKRIKRAWSPPIGETRNAEILFRINSNGQLASIKLVKSSGDENADQAALEAIAANAPFKPLPQDFAAKYLDVLYTFNYRVSELSEVGGKRM
jgi:protein TonB